MFKYAHMIRFMIVDGSYSVAIELMKESCTFRVNSRLIEPLLYLVGPNYFFNSSVIIFNLIYEKASKVLKLFGFRYSRD